VGISDLLVPGGAAEASPPPCLWLATKQNNRLAAIAETFAAR
jgi:hypothetical protein